MAGASGAGGTYIDPLIGARLGGYAVEAALGRGAMGAVYRAVQISLNRRVALKVMIPHLSQREDLVARFRREAMAAAALNHPNIVQVYDFGEEAGVCFYVMELVDGLSLGDYLNRGERFSEKEIIEVGREVTLALECAHGAGIIHRDLKPDNLMLTSRGMVKLADLGLARVQDLESDVALTLSGMSMGTPLYMSPEQAQGEKTVDHRADFYSLGATLFHLATGRVPFDGQTAGAILGKQLTGHVPHAKSFEPSLGQGFSDLMRWTMATHPVNRPSSHAQILEALERCHADALRRESAGSQGPSRIVSSTVAPAPRPEAPPRQVEVFVKQGKGWPIWAACGGVFLAIAVAGWLATRPAEEPTQVSTTEGTEIAKAEPAPAAPAPAPEIVEPMRIMGDDAAPPAVASTPAPQVPSAAPPTPEPEKKPEVAAPTAPPVTPVVSAPSKPFATPEELMAATKEKPFVNSLGMKFVPIPGTKVLFCIWETRVKDFEAFMKEGGYSRTASPTFQQTPDDPVVMVNWDDAKAFCAWLSNREGPGLEYRLPYDDEWDEAVGKETYPWGDQWPPPEGAGNFAGAESRLGDFDDPKDEHVIGGYRDGYPRTASVGSFRPSKSGLYDLLGNVYEWCEDWYTEESVKKWGYRLPPEVMSDIRKGDVIKVMRGGSWYYSSQSFLRSRFRYYPPRGRRMPNFGFRCALVAPSAFPALAEDAPASTLKLPRPNIRGQVVVWPLYKDAKEGPGLAQLPEELKAADDVCAIAATQSNGSDPNDGMPRGFGMAIRANGALVLWGALNGKDATRLPEGLSDTVTVATDISGLAVVRANGLVTGRTSYRAIPTADIMDVIRVDMSESGSVVYALTRGGHVVARGDSKVKALLPEEGLSGIFQVHGYSYLDYAGMLLLGVDGTLRGTGCYANADKTRRVHSFVADSAAAFLTQTGDVLYLGVGDRVKVDDRRYSDLPRIRKIGGRMRGVYENTSRQRELFLAAMDRKGDWHFVGEGLDVKGCEEASKNCIDIAFGNEHAIGLKVDDIKAAIAAEDEYEAKIRALLAPGAASAEGRAPSDEGKSTAVSAGRAPVGHLPSSIFNPEETKDLDGILAPLREAMASAKGAADERIARWVKELEEIEKKVAGRTDLDGALKVRREREAWAAGGRTPKPEASAKMPAEYSNPRYFLDRDLGLIDSRAESSIKKETSRALSGLRALEAKLTRATRLKAALAVREIAAGVEKGQVPGAVAGEPKVESKPEPAAAPAAPALGAAASSPKDATKDKPYVNSLGMKFVPIKGTGVLFSVWETRAKDFGAFVKESGYKWKEKAGFEQTPDDPVVYVSWDDAKAFCAWLSKKEGREYRLPTDEEWDAAVGKDRYPWGDDWPPPKKVENIAGEESKLGDGQDPVSVLSGYRDDHPRTAPVGSYKATKAGLYDMGGNVREWVEDWYTEALYKKSKEGGGCELKPEQIEDIKKGDVCRVLRGGIWSNFSSSILVSSYRIPYQPDERYYSYGFRCVVVLP